MYKLFLHRVTWQRSIRWNCWLIQQMLAVKHFITNLNEILIVWKLRSIISIFKFLLTTCECFPFLTISLFALSHSRKEELTQLKWKRPIIAHLQVAVKWTFHLAWNEKIIYRPITKKKGIMKKVWRFFSFFCLFFHFFKGLVSPLHQSLRTHHRHHWNLFKTFLFS